LLKENLSRFEYMYTKYGRKDILYLKKPNDN